MIHVMILSIRLLLIHIQMQCKVDKKKNIKAKVKKDNSICLKVFCGKTYLKIHDYAMINVMIILYTTY